MQEDFHYYATYCAAFIAGYSHEESLAVAWSAQFVDLCSDTLLKKIGGPKAAATTQLQMELLNSPTDIISLQNITRIWSAFHFLPGDLYAKLPGHTKIYMDKYRLICNPNGELLVPTVELAKKGTIEAVGIAMHVLADTWAHRYFAGTPSLVINNTNYYFYELLKNDEGEEIERKITLSHKLSVPDDPETGDYTGTVYHSAETSIMNLGHGRAGHLPDYSYIRYKYLPAWGEYRAVIKDNPSEYYHAFCQMVYALEYIRGKHESFETDHYAFDSIAPYENEIKKILSIRRINACEDWKAFGEKLSGRDVRDFDLSESEAEYLNSDDKDSTVLGRFFVAAMAQKSMVTNKIFKSMNMLAGFSVDYKLAGFKGIKDFIKLIDKRG